MHTLLMGSAISRRVIAATVFLLAALFLAASSGLVQAKEGQGEGGGKAQKRHIFIFKDMTYDEIDGLLKEVSKNPEIIYKVTIPNSTPKINRAIIRLSRTSNGIAAGFVIHLIKGEKKKAKESIRHFIDQAKAHLKHHTGRRDSIDKSDPNTKQDLIDAKASIKLFKRLLRSLERLLKVLK